MHLPRADLYGCSSLEAADSPSLSNHSTLHLELGPCGISVIHTGVSAGTAIMLVLFQCFHCWKFMDAFSLWFSGGTVQQQGPATSGSCFPSASSSVIFFSLSFCFRGCTAEIPVGVRHLQSHLFYAWWPVWVSGIVSIHCKRHSFDKGWELHLSEGIYSRGSLHFKKV